MKRILYVQSDSKLNGSGKALLNIISTIKGKYEIEVFLPNANDELGKKLQGIGIRCVGCPFPVRWYPKFKKIWKIYKNIRPVHDFTIGLFDEITAMKTLNREVNFFKPDIIHTNVGPVDIGYKIAHKHQIPHIWHLREYQDLDFGAHYFPNEKTFYSLIHSKDTHNIAITQGIYNHFHLDRNKDEVIYDGVIDANISPLYSTESPIGGRFFLYVSGVVSEKKGATDALLSFCKFAKENKDFKLVYVGQYYERDIFYQKLQSIIKENNLESRVLFLGRRNTEEVYNLMHHASAFLMLSKFEGFGFTTTEAMFNKCLVIGRNTAGTKEQFDNGLSFTGNEIGIRVENTDDIINAMRLVSNMNGNCRITRMIEDAKKTVDNLYTFQKYADNICRLYGYYCG